MTDITPTKYFVYYSENINEIIISFIPLQILWPTEMEKHGVIYLGEL